MFSILERFEGGETFEKKIGSGRKPLKLPQSQQELAGETSVRQCWCVTALFGQKVQHQQVLRASGTEESWCEELQVQEGPDTTPAQEQRQRTRLRKMILRSRMCSA